MKCINCAYFGSCELASEHITYCVNFKKRSYETKLVEKDGEKFKFERVEK